ncbi:MAG: hypothetical protein OK438_04315 [Thaumarchaeota archaeon]|nr:hypothetical protein [Nitrososphaerota archaeon]
MSVSGRGWEAVAGRLRLVSLNSAIQVLVPSLIIPTLPKGARGFSFYPGRAGSALGLALLFASSSLAWLLWKPLGLLGALLPLWLLGTTGVLMLASNVRPIAFVKPLCMQCRLLPVIAEHEAIHLSGVAGEKAVWASMGFRHSVESLSLAGDPAVCSFCPIPKRLPEH